MSNSDTFIPIDKMVGHPAPPPRKKSSTVKIDEQIRHLVAHPGQWFLLRVGSNELAASYRERLVDVTVRSVFVDDEKRWEVWGRAVPGQAVYIAGKAVQVPEPEPEPEPTPDTNTPRPF